MQWYCRRVRFVTVALVCIVGCQRHERAPTAAVATASVSATASSVSAASSPAAPPASATVSASTPCGRRPLAFRPVAGRTYHFTADERYTKDPEGTTRKHYTSAVVFGVVPPGWSAVEHGFGIPFKPWSHGDLTNDVLHWTLDAGGVPTVEPTQEGNMEFLDAMSLFRFRTPITLPSTCVGDTHAAHWTELGRLSRSVATTVLAADDRHVRLHVVIQRGRDWHQEGEVDVSLDDGLSGEARLHELGPEAPALYVNDTQRVIRVTHD